jgi:hypothetical protein
MRCLSDRENRNPHTWRSSSDQKLATLILKAYQTERLQDRTRARITNIRQLATRSSSPVIRPFLPFFGFPGPLQPRVRGRAVQQRCLHRPERRAAPARFGYHSRVQHSASRPEADASHCALLVKLQSVAPWSYDMQ